MQKFDVQLLMKRILLTGLFLLILTGSSIADISSSQNLSGNTVWTDSFGNSATMSQDLSGNDRIDFNDGSSLSCSQNLSGNVVCN